MADKIQTLKLNEYSKTTLREILDVLERVSPMELGVKELYQSTKSSWSIPEIGLNSKNITNREFENLIKRSTGESSIRRSYAKIYELYQTPITETEEKSTESNIPDKEARELQELERQKREAELKMTQEEAQKSVRESIEKKQEIYEKRREFQKRQEAWAKLQEQKNPQVLQKEAQRTVLTELKGKEVYAVPAAAVPVVALSENESKLVEIAKDDPQLFSQKLSELIIEKNPDIPPETIKPLSQVIAVDVTQSLVDPANKPIPTGVFAAVANAPQDIAGLTSLTQDELAKTASIFTTMSASQQDLYRTILTRSLGENITNTILGFPTQQYVLSNVETEGSFSVNLGQLQTNSFSFQASPDFKNFGNPLLGEAKAFAESRLKNLAFEKVSSLGAGKISQFVGSKTFDSIAPFLGVETSFSYVSTNFFGKTITTFLPKYAPFATNMASKLGIDIGLKAIAPVAAPAAAKTGEAIVAKGILGKAAVKVATKLGLTAAGQAAGSAVPIIGNIIAFIGTEILGKAVDWIKEHIPWKKIREFGLAISAIAIGAPMLLAGVLMGSTPLIVTGFGALAFGGAAAKGVTAAGVATGALNVAGAIGAATLGAIGTPIIATLLGFPLVVALILFIINSGAYVVPPGIPESPFAGNGVIVNCSDEKGPVGVPGPTSSSGIANRAWEISADLYQGFWCYWNRSPKGPPEYFPDDTLLYPPGYPELFDYSRFLSDPNPDPYSGVNLFWCTYLPIKAYTENGVSIGANVYTPSMYNDFLNKGKIINAADATPQNIPEGSVVFYHVTSGQNRLNHVGVVYSVDPGGMVVVESNAPIKSRAINFKAGGGVGNTPGIETKYFGLP